MKKRIIALVLVIATLFAMSSFAFTADGAVLQRPAENPLALRNNLVTDTKSIPNTQYITVPSVNFVDVPYGKWSHPSISAAVAFNLMVGTYDNRFDPTGIATVGEFNAVLKRLRSGKVTENDYVADSTKLTRHTAVYRAWLEIMRWTDPGVDIPERFTDRDQIPNWAKMAWAYCISKGIINGTSSTTLEPNAYMTREQLATFAVNVFLAYYGRMDIKNYKIVEGNTKDAYVDDSTGLNLRAEADLSDSLNVRMLMPYNDPVIVYGVYTSGIRWAVVRHIKSGLMGFCGANLLTSLPISEPTIFPPDPIPVPGPIIQPTQIILSNDMIRGRVGQTKTLSAVIYPRNATDQRVWWWSSNSSIVSINKPVTNKGESVTLTLKKVGCATIYAKTWNGICARCEIEINPSKFTINPNNRTLEFREAFTIQSNDLSYVKDWVIESGGKYVKIISKGKRSCRVQANDRFRGQAVIKAIAFDGLPATCTIHVIPPFTLKSTKTTYPLPDRNLIKKLIK